ncbi:DUF2459 domain-containing protein [Altererythrobacter endophyticus]|uniref:DUF2459 domain-containing protein n=2 Tax=Altericroceibacterium endophyticum TaxID=1808508 RepID=A0A6I4T3Z0_9SPHN|nr:DUF2459 domain-containing protein [Altericroceibacterium endophyticum]MXO64700.1 DUF2459 domain-containing protein [Altericroceibacterium endophyticum]
MARIGRISRAVVGWAFLLLGLAVLSAWPLSSIPRNPHWSEPDEGVTIMVESNGVHTALVMPLVTPEKDWRGTFPAADISASDRAYSHVSVSWGEKEIFLNTPTWWDLSPLSVLRIAGFGGDSLLHVAHYVRPVPTSHMRPVTVSRNEYQKLVSTIEKVAPVARTRHYPGYGAQDVFYDAPGNYTFTNTCNQWTSNSLAAAGIRTGWWTPFAGGVMKWVPDPS